MSGKWLPLTFDLVHRAAHIKERALYYGLAVATSTPDWSVSSHHVHQREVRVAAHAPVIFSEIFMMRA